MHKTLKLLAGAAIALASLGAASSASALNHKGNIQISVDENGFGHINGFLGVSALNWALQDDPGPGGLSNVLTYDLVNPPGLQEGDLLIFDHDGTFSDVVRFNPGEAVAGFGSGALVFYSDPLDGFDSLADTPSPPGAYYPETLTLFEGPRGRVDYIPLPGQPGYVAGASAPVEYLLFSDGPEAIPEPTTWTMMLLGVGALGAAMRRQRKAVLA
jgi:hypothetical protein